MENKMTINTATATQADIKAAETSELVAVYNKITKKTITKFSDRKTAEARTWAAIQQLAPNEDINKPAKKDSKVAGKIEKAPKAKSTVAPIKKQPSKRTMRFCFAPGAVKSFKAPRAGSLRAALFELLMKKNGLLFSEIHKAFPQWTKQNIYEAIRLIHFTTNYGMWSNLENGDIRVQIISDINLYKELVAESKAA